MTAFPVKHITVGGDDPFLPDLLAAINHATEICIAAAFIRVTGLNLIKEALSDALKRKATVRILTGDYLGITEPKALGFLMLLKEQGATVSIFESGDKISFHMKAYLFVRQHQDKADDGCIYVGSSNISRAALQSGLEWNLKVDRDKDEARFSEIFRKYDALFADARCQPLTYSWIEQYESRIPDRKLQVFSDVGANEEEKPSTPNNIQLEALVALEQTRQSGYKRGLVVMATGLGKTWLAAFDSEAFKAKRVLFVAHREEILEQAENTFVQIHPSAKVGRYNGKAQQLGVDMLFASIQTLGRQHHLQRFEQDYFDYIVVDEFHHAAALTYKQLLAHFKPGFLLGLTATPDRTDLLDILGLCDNNLVYTKGLFDGIEAKLLCPFQYYGVGDVVDYTEVKWRDGNFDPTDLYHQLATHKRAKHNFSYWHKHRQTRTLAFCISKPHADFMADYFEQQGVKAISVHSTSDTPRNLALEQLRQGEVEIIFSVDLFNEGVDLPSIDTVLMLRPTDSKIIFLQQLGRGLRLSKKTGKNKLVVLDFIGNHISFFRKAEALFKIDITDNARQQFIDKVNCQSLPLPKGCFVNYDLKAIDFMTMMASSNANEQDGLYLQLKASLGRRPSLVEFHRAGGKEKTIRKTYGQWFEFVASQGDLSTLEFECLQNYGDFYLALENTDLPESFKLILLEAMIELKGFVSPLPTLELAIYSWEILQRRRILLNDLPKKYRGLSDLPADQHAAWHSDWLENPMKLWLDNNGRRSFFTLQNQAFTFKDSLADNHHDAFTVLTLELVNFRYQEYESKPSKSGQHKQAMTITPIGELETQEIPYFSDLKVAGGYFDHVDQKMETSDTRSLPLSYGKLDPNKHFITNAKDHSMDGGQHPIKNNDLLLFEKITAESIESNHGKTIAIRRFDVTDDGQYLLRKVNKQGQGPHQLIAQNPDDQPIMVNDNMETFARFKAIVDPVDLYLHQTFLRTQIPALFGFKFNPGNWNSGYVSPKGQPDQFLFVTLNKRGHGEAFRYHDTFEDHYHFNWQSQGKTSSSMKKGLEIIEHAANGSRVYLFVRKNKLDAVTGKAGPFYCCGTLQYQTHKGEQPMNVKWRLDRPLSDALLQYFK